jgi:hypothetical protein
VAALGFDEFAAVQGAEGGLHGALGESGFLRDLVVAQADRFGAFAGRASAEEEIDHEGGGTVVVADEVAEEHVDDVMVEVEDGHGAISVMTIVDFKRLYDPAGGVP